MSYITNSFISSDKEVPSYDKRISICLEANGFSFSIVSVQNELLTFGAISFEGPLSMSEAVNMIRNIWNEHNVVPFGFHELELVTASRHFVLVPDELYEQGDDRKYLEPLVKIPFGLSVFSAHNDDLGAQVVFTADTNLVSAFKIAMPGLKVRCQYNKLVNADLMKRSQMKSVMLLNMRKDSMDVIVYCNRKVQLVNSYASADTQEAIYNAVNVMKQLHLENAQLDVLICGDVDRECFGEMSRFLPNTDLYCGLPLTKSTVELQHLHTYHHALILS
jgi:hypothetical protein